MDVPQQLLERAPFEQKLDYLTEHRTAFYTWMTVIILLVMGVLITTGILTMFNPPAGLGRVTVTSPSGTLTANMWDFTERAFAQEFSQVFGIGPPRVAAIMNNDGLVRIYSLDNVVFTLVFEGSTNIGFNSGTYSGATSYTSATFPFHKPLVHNAQTWLWVSVGALVLTVVSAIYLFFESV